MRNTTTRKGAIAVYLEPWHMDIVDFIDLKKNSGEERRRAHDLFPSLWISDIFMERVRDDAHWTLFDPYDVKDLSECYGAVFTAKYIAYENDDSITKNTMKAKDLWKKILTSYFESGSPFLCFKDTANRANPNPHKGHIRSSNLCTEIFQNTNPNYYMVKVHVGKDGSKYTLFNENDIVELANGTTKLAKKLSALDKLADDKYPLFNELGYLVKDARNETIYCTTKAFKDDTTDIYLIAKHKVDGNTAVCNLASINLSRINTKEDIERVTPIAVRMLDNVIDLNFYPVMKVKKTNLASRSIGLGVMGEAEMLAVAGIIWGSDEHLNIIDGIMESVCYNTLLASSNLSIEKGCYPDFEGSNWSKGILPHDHATSTTNALTDRDLTYDWEYLRNKIQTDGMRNGYLMAVAPTSSISILVGTTQAIEPVYKRKWYEENLSGLIPVVVPKLSAETWNYYTPAFEVDQLRLIKAAAVRQKWIDQGQSTNIFLNLEVASGKHMNDIYMLAWKLGLKSTYYLRSQSPEASNNVADRTLECSGCQ